MTHGSLFSGIGGFDLAAQWMGWENVFHCEWNEFGKRVLSYYWPNAISYHDITETDFNIHRGQVDILTGGFPCQPYSAAGKRLGKADDRHLWPEMLRAIREIQPRWIVGENVRGLTNWNGGLVFDEVQADLETAGYEVTPFLLPACAVNAPHRRGRIWFVAYREDGNALYEKSQGRKGGRDQGIRREKMRSEFKHIGIQSITPNPNSAGRQKQRNATERGKARFIVGHNRKNWANFPTQSPICGRNDGIPAGLDGIAFPKWRNESIRAYGNAVVPQVVYQIFKAIQQYETTAQQPT